MRLLLDTNILIQLEDSQVHLSDNLAKIDRIARKNGHELVYHPASENDINRDPDSERRRRTLQHLKRYNRLATGPPCPWNTPDTSPNDICDNEILYALDCNAAHALITEDQGIHTKASTKNLSNRVYTIQTAEDWLQRLHATQPIPLPNIEEVALHTLTPQLNEPFFATLRSDYQNFDEWFKEKAREGRKAWVYRVADEKLGAICIFAHQVNEEITDEGQILSGPALKLCTFKVAPSVRGRKIGELFLKAAFKYATANSLQHIFIHGAVSQQHFLFHMLKDFGFSKVGTHPGSNGQDHVYLKKHPSNAPQALLEPFEYLQKYFPHFRHDQTVAKFIVPILPKYHRILFPDYGPRQMRLFPSENQIGNAIKLAYLCRAGTKEMKPGDIVLFYRSEDEREITSLGILENYETHTDAATVATKVKRRTVYSMKEIEEMIQKPIKVMLFRVVKHFTRQMDLGWLKSNNVIKGAPQSITKISNEAFEKVLNNGK